ncbi:sigma factor, partial [Paraburkholderia sp. SIMBA_050]
MSDSTRATLRDLLALRYEDLKRRLTWRLGSSELASDALHDTWVHLEDRSEESGPVKSPAAYLMRMATNLALDRL